MSVAEEEGYGHGYFEEEDEHYPHSGGYPQGGYPLPDHPHGELYESDDGSGGGYAYRASTVQAMDRGRAVAEAEGNAVEVT